MLFYSSALNGQHVIDMDGYKGVLFADTVKLTFNIDSMAERFTPSLQEISLANTILLENTESLVKVWGSSFNREAKKSCRQFIGYIDLNGAKHVLILLLNMRGRNANHYFKDWKVKPIVGFGDFYERNLKILNVNLNQKTIKVF
jgi:hypothetical protein